MKLRVLLLDDDALLLEAMTCFFRSRGHEVFGYSYPVLCPLYGDSACTCAADEQCVDIVLSDNAMPHMTGLEFIRQQSLRGCKGAVRHKAIMSGSWTADELRLAGDLGCRIFSKPVDLRELLEWLTACEVDIAAARGIGAAGA